ncbi:MAG: 16S rRNA (cytosine(1402)-N(4))-methyltransferase RsmH [Candidatus Saccharibacteria bacterium]|nr:16S rRNA (cytosine(1402)-N(4))-methyltransferase RsmH [Candidatus Saccharibacteria bacterium]
MEELHKPVLLSEVIANLDPKPGESYLDLTAGYAGHAKKILAVTQNYKGSSLVDRDDFAVDYLTKNLPSEVQIIHDDFYRATQLLIECGKTFDMILADFGVSSPQIDRSDRGFSFLNDGPLDMRMDKRQKLDASTIVNKWHPRELEEIFVKYGEEKPGLAKKHARIIVEGRPFSTTKELADAIAFNGRISKSKGTRWHGKHPATQVFQAIRIAVNDELGLIERTLPLLPRLLNPGGRVAIITFHSLEDRLVKRYFKEETSLGLESEFEILTKSPIVSGELELVINPRAASAKLRVYKKRG